MKSTRRILLFLAIGLPLLVISYFAPSAYRKSQMDAEVDRLCAVDGGIKVFERIFLPSEKFDQFGNPNVPLSSSKAVQFSPYVIDAELSEVTKGDPSGRGTPTLRRYTSKIVRISDGKVLGIAVGYSRFGGESEGPWHPSSYTGCTEEPGKQLSRAVIARMPRKNRRQERGCLR